MQDYIAECLTEPWPPNADAPREMLLPEVVVQAGAVEAWFRDRSEPGLVLDPIPLRKNVSG